MDISNQLQQIIVFLTQLGFRLGDDITQAFNKIIPVLIIGEYPPTLDSTNNNMMQGSGSIDACFAWHTIHISQYVRLYKL